MSSDLAQRVQENDQLQRAAVETTPRSKSVLDLIKGRRSLYAAVLNDTIDPERFVRVALATVGRTPGLLACKQESLLGALMLSAQLGLEPGTPLGHAYLVPFGQECTFIVGYKGYLELARRSGQIASIYAEAVFEGDDFSWELGLSRDIKHRPLAANRTDYAKLTHVYAVAKLRDKDADPIFVVLTRDQIEATRSRSRAKNNGPWKTDPIPMALKTGVRRLATWMPLSIEMAQAAAHDERAVTKLDANLDDFVDDLDMIDVDPVATPSLSAGGDAEAGPPGNAVDAEADAAPPAESPSSGPSEESARSSDGPDVLDDIVTRAKSLVDQIVDEARPQWIAYMRTNGLSSNAARWTRAQAEAVIRWIESPLHGTNQEETT